MPMTTEQVMVAYLDAWSRGDPEGAFALYADDVVMRLPGRTPEAGTHSGREAVAASIRSLLGRLDGLEVEVRAIETAFGPTRAFILVHERGKRGDAVLDIRRVNTYRVRNGKIVEIEIFEGDQYDVDGFFGVGPKAIGETA
jgi:ketosteroid isomerase-like protein